MNHRLFSMMYSISSKLHHQPVISCGHKLIETFPANFHKFLGSSKSRNYSVQPNLPPSSGVQPNPKVFADKEVEDEKRKLAAQLIAKGIKSIEEEDKKLRLKDSKMAKMDWKALEQSLSMWQVRIADLLQQVQDMIPQSIKNKVKGR
ncbi:hypothetical protein LSTR_LSTR013318 [Laodelphax striatellus]|uniref:Uncharacterized protein n=1 Tax=Laodelphax striatellus TaxID=195883 RepID=A0A482WPE1_LAOST|nr:hypothetical protein LSTR_LSTR013318 [Laodelphax striatellus]